MAFDLSTYHADPMAGLGNPRKYPILAGPREPFFKSREAMAAEKACRPNYSGRTLSKAVDLRPGDLVSIHMDGLIREVVLTTIEFLRDGSAFNFTGTYPGGFGYIAGQVRISDMTLTLMQETPGDGRSKAAKSSDDGTFTKSAPFKVGDTVKLREHQVVRIAKLEKVQPAGDDQLYIQASGLSQGKR